MAEINPVINLQIRGQSKLERLIGSVDQLASIVNSINKEPLNINVKSAIAQFDKFDTELKTLNLNIGNSEKKIDNAGNSINEYANEIAKLQSKLNQLNPNTAAYNKVLGKQQDAIKNLAKAQKDLANAEADLESSRGKVKPAEDAVKKAKLAIDASKSINTLADDYLRLGKSQERGVSGVVLKKQLEPTIAQLTAQAEVLGLVASNSRIASSEFNRFTIASQVAGQKIFQARQKQLSAIAFGLSPSATGVNIGVGGEKTIAGAREQIQQLVNLYPSIVKSEAALSSYSEELRSIQSLVPYTSAEYRVLEEALAGVNKELSEIGLRGQKSVLNLSPITKGPATELGSIKEYQQRQKYEDDLLATRRKLERLSVSLDASVISQNDKLQIRNQLGEAFNALEQKNFSLAKSLSAEADRYIRDARRRKADAEKESRQVAAVTKALEKGELAGIKLVAQFRDSSDLDAWVNGFVKIENSAQEILDLSKKLGEEFDKKLKRVPLPEKPFATRLGGGAEAKARADYLKKLEAEVAQGPAVKLGGGAELAARQKFDKDQLNAANKKIDLNTILQRQLVQFRKLENDFILEQQKGVGLTEQLDRLLNDIRVISRDNVTIDEHSIKVIGERLRLQRAILALEVGRAKTAGTYGINTAKTTGKTEAQIIEERRSRLLLNALSLQGNIVSVESRGAAVQEERLGVEAKILQLKELQNKASQADLALIAQQIQELRIKTKEQAAGIPVEKKKVPFLERRFGAQRAGAISEGLIGGAFPLLFGQGLGASVGGGLGGALGGLAGGGLGFGLSLAGTAIGAELDKSVASAMQLNAAFLTVSGSYSEIRKQGIQFTAELESQVNLLRETGNFAGAKALERGAITSATGDIGGRATEGIAAAGAVLGATWNDTYKSIQTTLGIIASPFLFALNALLTPIKALFQGFNAIASGVGKIIGMIPGVGDQIERSNEEAYKLTQEYQDQIAAINKQIIELSKLNKISEGQLGYSLQAIGLGRADTELMKDRAAAAKRLAENELEIEKIRRENPSRTQEQRNKINELVSQQQKKYINEEAQIAAEKAQNLFLEISDNNREIAWQKRQYEQQYQDMVLDLARQQESINLDVARKVQDERIRGIEEEARFAKEMADEKLRAEKLAARERSLQATTAALGGQDPFGDELLNSVQSAVDEWRTGRKEVENEAADRERQIQIAAQKAEITLQRYKYDMAVTIARTNEDSQRKIARINEQINKQNEEVSRHQYMRQALSLGLGLEESMKRADIQKKTAQEALASGKLTPSDQEFYKNQLAQVKIVTDTLSPLYNNLLNIVEGLPLQGSSDRSMLKPGRGTESLSVASVPAMGALPNLTNPSAAAAAATNEVNQQITANEKLLASVRKVQGLKEADLALAEKILGPQQEGLRQITQIRREQEQKNVREKEYTKLIMSGVNPELAEQLANVRAITAEYTVNIPRIIAALQKAGAPQPIIDQLNTLLQNATTQSALTEKTLTESDRGKKIRDFVNQATSDLNDLESVAIRVSQSIGDAVGQSLTSGVTSLIDGTATAQEVFANFMKSIADVLMQEAAKMIATYTAIGIAKMFAGMGSNMGGSGYFDPKTGLGVAGPNFGLANGGVFNGNGSGISTFANGGMFTNSIVKSPTLFKFADGGALRSGVMGEAGPEAVMPLTRASDGRLGVDASGLDSAGNKVEVGQINITVENKGDQLSPAAQKQIAGQVRGIVLATLVDQKRGGGILR